MKRKLLPTIIVVACILVLAITGFMLFSSKSTDLKIRDSEFRIEMEKLSLYTYINGDEILFTSTQNKSQNDIYSYLISTGKITQITNKTDSNEVFPIGNGKYLAWVEKGNTKSEKDRIVLCDRQTMQPKVISNSKLDCNSLLLLEDLAIWTEQTTESGKMKAGLTGYRISTSEIFEIQAPDFDNSMQYGCDGKNVVWTRYHGDNCEIVLFNLESRTRQIIAHENLKASTPKIDGDIIIWEDHRNYNSGDIYAYIISKKVEVAVDTRKGVKSENPRIIGNKILYLSKSETDREQNLVTLASVDSETLTAEITDICTRKSWKFRPNTDGNWVIWEEKESFESTQYKVVAHRLDDHFETIITEDGRFPRIKNGLCMWFAQERGKMVAKGVMLR